MSLANQLATEFQIVVYRSVEYHRQLAVCARHGLFAILWVNNRKTTVAQEYPALLGAECTLSIGTAMPKHCHHLLHESIRTLRR